MMIGIFLLGRCQTDATYFGIAFWISIKAIAGMVGHGRRITMVLSSI